MNRRERITAVFKGEEPDRTPMGFWMHFPTEQHHGEEALAAQLKYFEETKTDICKVMNENLYPVQHPIMEAADWADVKACGRNHPFIRSQVELVKRIVDSTADDAPVIATVHGIVASASHALMQCSRYDKVGRYAQLYHLRTNPDSVYSAYQAIAESLTILAEECIAAGADGIYYAALGGERDGFTAEEHARYIAPLEEQLMREIDHAPIGNILHMCKPLVDLERYVDYPCEAVNWGILESGVKLFEGRKLFPGKVIMGGMDDGSQILISGSPEELEREVHNILAENDYPGFILASDCTLPGNLPYERIRMMEKACETYRGGSYEL